MVITLTISPYFCAGFDGVTSHYFCKQSPTGWIKRLYPTSAADQLGRRNPRWRQHLYGAQEVRDRAAGVPDISSSCEGSALDPLPTEAAKRLILSGAYSRLSACRSSQASTASRHYRT